MPNSNTTVLALDVGERRVGIAAASLVARLPGPLTTLIQGDSFFAELQKLIEEHSVSDIVIGLPRGLDGQDTEQTVYIAEFAKSLKDHFALPVHFQDEALTSKKAEQELQARGKEYRRGDIDALAATYILDDWLKDHPEYS